MARSALPVQEGAAHDIPVAAAQSHYQGLECVCVRVRVWSGMTWPGDIGSHFSEAKTSSPA